MPAQGHPNPPGRSALRHKATDTELMLGPVHLLRRECRLIDRLAQAKVWICALGFVAVQPALPAQNLLANGGFEEGACDWTLAGAATLDRAVARSGAASLRVCSGGARQDIVGLPPGAQFTCTVALKVQNVQPTAAAGYAYIAVYQLDEFDDIITARDFVQRTGTTEWQTHHYTFTVAEGCRTVSVRCGLFQATGTAWFDDFALVAGAEPVEFSQLAAAEAEALVRLGLPTNAAGRVAIFKDDIPPDGAPSDPDHLASVLRAAGFGVAFLDSAQLADRHLLNRAAFDVLILPYGASFPVQAAENFRRFLRAGGKFLSTGGYAFDNLLERTPQGWRSPAPPASSPPAAAVWRCDIPAAELRGKGELTFSGWLKTARVTGPGMAFFAVYQIAADGNLPEWRDLCKVTGTQDWQEHRYSFNVHPRAATVSLRAGLYRCSGVAAFDDIRLTDASGQALFSADFEDEFNPDQPGPKRWVRSDRALCEVQSRTRHSGQRALKARLDLSPTRPERLNTRHGRPEDGLEVEPSQLGVFQPDYPLERVAFAAAAPDQCVLDAATRLEGALAGFAACGVVGFDHARWVPLLNAYDCYGRLRGAAGALLRHYAGPYAGSSWSFFGVTNCDLFAPTNLTMATALSRIVGALVEDVYWAALVPEPACVRQGEPVKLLATLCNGGRKPRTLGLRVEIFAGVPHQTPPLTPALSAPNEEGVAGGMAHEPNAHGSKLAHSQRAEQRRGSIAPSLRPGAAEWSPSPLNGERAGVRGEPKPVATLTQSLTLLPGQTNLVTAEWAPSRFTTDFYCVLGHLEDGPRELDRIESGFVVWDPKVIAAGPKLSYRDNYLRFGKRPLFLFGTDDWSYVFNTARETPLQWMRDMRLRRDLGVLIYENLQLGQYFEHLPVNRLDAAARGERLSRKIDGVVQLAQRYGQVYFPCLLCGYNVAVSDTELAQQREFCRAYAQRYAHVPGLIYYLNGDLRCRLSDAVTPQWNQFLRERYGDTARLRVAWGQHAPAQELGSIPAEDFHDWGHAWDNIKVYDQNLFRAWLIRRWTSALIDGIRQHDRSHPTTCEFYQLPHEGVDIPAAIGELDLSNFGYFDRPGADLARLPAISKFNDQRTRGKSFGPGEYGVKTHPAWGDGQDYGYHITRTRAQAIELFLAVAHYTLGLGGSRIHNWCWKDDAHRVFPWGMIWPCDGVPKDTAYVHRNQSLLFRHFAPVYRPPAVYVLTADMHRMGGGKWEVIEGILQGFNLALATHVENLGTLNDCALEIPRTAKVIFYPLPFCVPDPAYGRLLDWVRHGGVLYLSGDCSYDELRRRTLTHRLEELCGVRFIGQNYPNIAVAKTNAADQPCIRVEPVGAEVRTRAADGTPLVLEHRLGKGRVIFCTDPIELHSLPQRRERELALYRSVLAAAGVRALGLEPDDPRLHLFRVPLRDGGAVWVLFNTDATQPTRTVTLTDCAPPVALTVARNRPALVWFDGHGKLRAVEVQGDCRLGAQRVVSDTTAGIVLALDGRDLRQARALVLMPLQAGTVRIATTVAWPISLAAPGSTSPGSQGSPSPPLAGERAGVRGRNRSKAPIVEVGEFHDGAWAPLARAAARLEAGELVVQVQAEQVFSLLLLCEEAALPKSRAALSRAMTDPSSLP